MAALLHQARSCRSATAASAPRAAVPPVARAASATFTAAATAAAPSSSLTQQLPQPQLPSLLRSLRSSNSGSRSPLAPRASPDGVAATAAASAAAAATSTSERNDLIEYAAAGPLIASCGLTPDDVSRGADEWCALGARLALQLGFVPAASAGSSSAPTALAFSTLDPVQRLRIYRYYLPVFFWVRAQLDAHAREHSASPSPPPPLVLGISAPQGCGKTTLTEQLTELFTFLGVRVAGVSIDDFYLTRAEQQALADANPGNRLLELRGNAGSHDLALGERCLAALKGCDSAQKEVAVPRYDKSAFEGKGDRAPEATWPRVSGPVQLVLFEGWMLGFRPGGGGDAAPSSLTADERRDLEPVDAALQSYPTRWDRFVDSWLVVRVGDPRWVFAWRLQAEQAMRANGKTGMSDDGVADFVSRYLPAYAQYLPSLYAQGPTTARKGKTLVVEVDEKRSPVEKQPPPPSLGA